MAQTITGFGSTLPRFELNSRRDGSNYGGKLSPALAIRNHSMKFLSLVLLCVGIGMIPSDLMDIEARELPWTVGHLVVRLLCCASMLVLLVRAFQNKVQDGDFQFFLFAGMIYVLEGTFFNPAYYLAYIQLIAGLTFLSTLPRQRLYSYLPICLGVYIFALILVYTLGEIDRELLVDYLIACVIATVGGAIGVVLRDYCISVYESIVNNYVEANGKLIDMGSQVGIICHDMNGLLRTLKTNLALIERQGAAIEPIRDSFEPLKQATDHMIRLQEFVLSMCKKEGEKIEVISGTNLVSMLRTLVPDFCPQAKGYLSIECDVTQFYRCSPAALCYALVNAVRNSVEAMTPPGQNSPETNLSISVSVGVDVYNNMLVVIKDNGPGFPPQILNVGIAERISTKLEKGGSGMGFSNILRYITYQGGTVEIRNMGGAEVIFKIPQSGSPLN
jgi:signal transduction histidine kinase